MIYFYDKYLDEARKVIRESHELRDVANDLHRLDEKKRLIEWAYTNPVSYNDLQQILKQARELDFEIRKKYPTIDRMLEAAERFPKMPRMIEPGNHEKSMPAEHTLLEQDHYGILCHTLLKKGITSRIEEIISHVVV